MAHLLNPSRDPPADLNGYDPMATAPPGAYWDPDEADKKAAFFPTCLTHAKGRHARKPFVLGPWQRDYVRTLFGWKLEDGYRRYRESLLFVPRKNGKTQLAAGIGGAALYADREQGAECYCTGYDREQALFLYQAVAHFVENCRALRKRSKIRKTANTISFRDNGSYLKALPASEKGGHGANTHFVAYDEFHLWNTPRHVEVYDSLHTSTGDRQQPLEVILTTAGYDQQTLCYERYEHACRVRDGLTDDPTFLPLLYEKPSNLEWSDPRAWEAANPNLGVSIRRDYIEREYAKARTNPAAENVFRRLHLNEWTSQESRWIPMHAWRECWGTPGDLPADAPRAGGLDLSATTDLTAFVRVMRTAAGGYRSHGHYFAPASRVVAMRRRGLPVDRWIRGGWLTPIPGTSIELGPIAERVKREQARTNRLRVGYDPWNANAIRQELEGAGVTMVEVRQGPQSLSSACKEFERAVLAGKWDHSGDPLLAWAVENVQVKTDDNGNVRPTKPPHGSEKKIDPVSACLTALAVLLASDDAGGVDYTAPGMSLLL